MINKIPKMLLLPSLAAVLLFNGQLFADDQPIEDPISKSEEHVSVRARAMDPARRDFTQERRAKEREDEEEGKKEEAAAMLHKASYKFYQASTPFMLAPRKAMSAQFSFTANSYPINCHWLTSIGDSNRTIEIEDGSHWEICSNDAYVLRNWKREDSLVITPNYNWWSNYDYYITNKSNNSYVKANLYIGPVAYGPYSHWIVNIDYYAGHVALENQVIWCIDPRDGYLLKDWAVNDHIILGLYDSWFSPYDHILINVNMDEHARAKQY